MRRKEHPFRSGFIAGLSWPVLLLLAVMAWVYRLTGMVPFPVRRSNAGELAVALVDPRDVPGLWRRWRDELAPLIERVEGVLQQVRTVRDGTWLERS